MSAPAAQPPTPACPRRSGSAASRIVVELKEFFRDRESAVFNFMLPMFLLVIFGSVFSGQELGPTGITFAQYFVAGMIASGILYTSFQNLAISIPLERENGSLKRLQGTPMPKMSYFIGKVGMVFTAYVAQVVILIAVGVALLRHRAALHAPTGGSPSSGSASWGSSRARCAGSRSPPCPSGRKGASALVTPIVLVLQFTSGVFFLFQDLPSWMQTFASLFPLKWLTQGMRYVFLPGQRAGPGGGRRVGAAPHRARL